VGSSRTAASPRGMVAPADRDTFVEQTLTPGQQFPQARFRRKPASQPRTSARESSVAILSRSVEFCVSAIWPGSQRFRGSTTRLNCGVRVSDSRNSWSDWVSRGSNPVATFAAADFVLSRLR
jgi:hypothetical protein